MAKKDTSTAVVERVQAAEETQALAKVGERRISANLQALDGVDANDKRGLEGTDKGDFIIPRLALCQSNSPQRKRANDKFIPGLEEGGMFNTLTQELYEQNLPFIPIVLRKHAIEFKDMDQGGGIIDRNVPFNDPRCEYDNSKTGKEAKPKATRFYDWLSYLPETGELVVISFKGSSEKAGKKIVTLSSTVRPGPVFSHLYRLSTANKQENGYDWHLFNVVPAGKPEVGDALIAEQAYEKFKGGIGKYDEDTAAEVAGEVVDGEVEKEL